MFSAVTANDMQSGLENSGTGLALEGLLPINGVAFRIASPERIGIPDKWPALVAFLVLRDRVRIPPDNGGHRRPILLLADGPTPRR